MSNHSWNQWKDSAFKWLAFAAAMLGIAFLLVFLFDIFSDGYKRVNWQFLTSLPSFKAEKSGIKPALFGSIWVFFLTAAIAVPIGIAAGIYLEEYGRKNFLFSFLEINISNLAGIPSIIYGLLGLEIFVRTLKFGNSILAGSATLALLILPIIIVATREALRAVPRSIREASYGIGATKWQTIWHQVLPAGMGGILTGIILALSRAIGETAPLIIVGAVAYMRFVPNSPMSEFTVLPMQIFNWASRPQAAFLENAAAGIIVLIVITFVLNGSAVLLRNYTQKKVKW